MSIRGVPNPSDAVWAHLFDRDGLEQLPAAAQSLRLIRKRGRLAHNLPLVHYTSQTGYRRRIRCDLASEVRCVELPRRF